MSRKVWLGLIAIIIITFGGLIVLNQNRQKSAEDQSTVSSVDTGKILAGSETTGGIADHVVGKRDAKVVIVQYSDYSCVYCAEHSPRIHQLIANSELSVALVYRHYPIAKYPNSKAAAAAAEAAGKQNKFWEMSDLLYRNQLAWSQQINNRDQIFEDYAQQLDLDMAKYRDDYASDEINKKINFDKQLGSKDNLTGTPAFFYNSQPIEPEVWGDSAKLIQFITDKQ